MSTGYHTFHYGNTILGYQKAGKGSESILLFHGFGQDNTIFNSLINELGDRFTLYSFDLFFHGQSKWLLDETPLSKIFWKELLGQFLIKNNIEKFSLIGFSLGGKFALACLEGYPARINSIVLIAPDGIKTNFWYSLATYPLALRSLFKSMIIKPGRFLSFVKLARLLKLADAGIIRFAKSQMDTEEKRKRVYYSWIVFRMLKFDMKDLAAIINTHKIQLTVIIGKFDKIITVKNVNRLLLLTRNHDLKVLEAGHNNLIEESKKVFRNIAWKSPQN